MTLSRVTHVSLLATVALTAGVLSWFAIENPDFWWDLAAGRYMVETGTIPHTNTFSYADPEHPWVNLHWLYDMALYRAYAWSGPAVLVALKAFIIAAAWTVAYCAMPRRPPSALMALMTIVAIGAASERFSMRVEIFTFLFLAVYFFILERALTGRVALLWVLVPLHILWANVHGLFVLGWMLTAAYAYPLITAHAQTLAHERTPWLTRRRHFVPIPLVLLAPLVTPYGMDGWLFPLTLATRFDSAGPYASTIAEFMPPPLVGFLPGQGFILCFWAALAAGTLVVLRGFRRVGWHRLVVFVAFAALAVTARRNVALFCLALVPLVQAARVPVEDDAADSPSNTPSLFVRIKIAGAVVVIVGALTTLAGVLHSDILAEQRYHRTVGAGVDLRSYPVEAATYLRTRPPRGRLFHGLRHGGFLLWELCRDHAPACYRRRILIDGRLEAYSPEFYQRTIDVYYAPPLLAKLIPEYTLQTILLDPMSGVDQDVIRYFHARPEYRPVFLNPTGIVFERTSPGTAPSPSMRSLYERAVSRITPQTPVSHIVGLGQTLLTLGEPALARKVLSDGLQYYPQHPDVLYTLTRLFIATNNVPGAQNASLTAIRVHPNDDKSWEARGYRELLMGHNAKAREAFGIGLSLNPMNMAMRYHLGVLLAHDGEFDSAIRHFRKIVTRSPASIHVWKSLAEAQMQHAPEDARASWTRVRTLAQRFHNEELMREAERRLDAAP